MSLTDFQHPAVTSDDLRLLVNSLRQGACCSIIAPSNMGKSYLLRSLTTDEVRRMLAHDDSDPPIMVLVNCLEAGDNEQSFYELLLRRVIDELQASGLLVPTLELLKNFHSEILRSDSGLVARSLFASSARELDREHRISLMLLLDNFDDAFQALPPWPFRELRAIRDEFGIRLCYVTSTTRRLDDIRSDDGTIEFRELFYACAHVLRPLSKEAAQAMLANRGESQGVLLDSDQRQLAVELSGGHPGLLEQISQTLSTIRLDHDAQPSPIISRLIEQERVRQECQRLWDELEEQDRQALLVLVGSTPSALTSDQAHALETKGLVALQPGGTLAIFSPVFEAFVKSELHRREHSTFKGLRCNPESGQIWADNREVTLGLSEPQRKLVKLLYRKSGQVVTYQEIAEQVWGAGEGVSPGAIYELVKRVRKKVEPDWTHPRYIVTVPGEGYRLENTK